MVVVSQGSIRPDVGELLEPTITDLADSDVLVVVTTGSGDPDQLVDRLDGQVPSNVRITRFVPYDLLLEHADVFVTNGGYTGVTLALAHGVPIVQAGTTEEKAEIAARIEWTGVGVKLGTTTPTPAAVRSGVEKVLAVPAFAAAAERLRQEMAAHDAGREGADLLEQLATTGRLVPRVDAAIDAQVPVR